MTQNYHQDIQNEFARLLQSCRTANGTDVIRLDLHCHDKNSNVPDELLGRILRSRETWLSTDDLLRQLKRCGQEVFTITNHNNARSCFRLQDAGVDVLVGAEFTCHVPLFRDVSVHVLTYGFTPSEEEALNLLRRDLFAFLEYTQSRQLPVVLAHPLYFHDPNCESTVELIEIFTLLFDNFEVLNGQRDLQQTVLMARWLESLSPEKMEALGKKHRISPTRFSTRPYRKTMTGGSDCHMGLFAGTCGTAIEVENLSQKRQTTLPSELVKTGLLEGAVSPYGDFAGGVKLTATFLEFFAQLTMYLDDPGLIRMLLHKGSVQDKLLAFLILNATMEMRRHRYTSRFLRTFHETLKGKSPGFIIRRMTHKRYRPLLRELTALAESRQQNNQAFVQKLERTIPGIFAMLTEILSERVDAKLKQETRQRPWDPHSLPAIEDFEVPAYIRSWFGSATAQGADGANQLDVISWADGLSFPALAASTILGAQFASMRVQHGNREFLDRFAEHAGAQRQPDRLLWLSDTYFERNGVCNSLRLFTEAAEELSLPITIAVSSERTQLEGKLHEFKASFSMTLPFYKDQPIRFVNIMEIDEAFRKGSYTRLLVSTEGQMGLCALYLKYAYSVPAYFYLHTDWLEYAKQSLHFEAASLDRLRRMLRWFYSQFDGIFVLNSQQAEWLAGTEMEIPREKIHLTAHWCNQSFFPRPLSQKELLWQGDGRDDEKPGTVLLYAGRLSKEKGVLDLAEVYHGVRNIHPNIRLVIVGSGPEKERLAELIPEALMVDWVPPSELARYYAASDIFLFPSSFDTFGNSVLEALSSGVPAVAYNQKGPKDIIEDGISGFLVHNKLEMTARVIQMINDSRLLKVMKLNALKRSKKFARADIVQQMMQDLKLQHPPASAAAEPPGQTTRHRLTSGA